MVKASYHTGVPTAQAAVDIFKGEWKSAFPPEAGVAAGTAANFEDRRVRWVDHQLGGLRHRSVLELGPYEGYITYQLCRLGAAPIVAVEASNVSYMKCLIAKEVLGIDARFLHGDIQMFMDETPERFDLCWATGVLYHQVDPLALLRAVAKISDRVFVWTHFFDEVIETQADRYPHFDASRNVDKELDGFRCRHYYRSYLHKGEHPPRFSGGSNPFAYWLTKDDILRFMAELGLTDIVIRSVASDHKAGPTMSFLASRPIRPKNRLRRTFAHLRKNLVNRRSAGLSSNADSRRRGDTAT